MKITPQQIADEIRRLLSEAGRNPSTPMETIAQLRDLEKALRQTAEGAMQNAADALAQAGAPANPGESEATNPPPSIIAAASAIIFSSDCTLSIFITLVSIANINTTN